MCEGPLHPLGSLGMTIAPAWLGWGTAGKCLFLETGVEEADSGPGAESSLPLLPSTPHSSHTGIRGSGSGWGWDTNTQASGAGAGQAGPGRRASPLCLWEETAQLPPGVSDLWLRAVLLCFNFSLGAF